MLLVDATGASDSRFHRIDAALMDLIYGSTEAVFINRSVGNGVFTYTEAKLKQASETAKYHFPVNDIRLSSLDNGDVEVLKAMALRHGGIVIIDEAQDLDRIEGAAEALRALESPYIKFVYVALVHTDEMLDALEEVLAI